jgi:K+-sensing histidine kinase KdpD
MAAQQSSFETEGWRVRKDGSRFWADVLISAVYDKDRTVVGFTKVTRDFSQHKMAEEETKILLQKEKDLNRMKSNFVSIASHEFRTPLSTILSSFSLLEKYKTTETQSNREQHILRIKASIKELVGTLDGILSLEKIEEGKVEPKKRIVRC